MSGVPFQRLFLDCGPLGKRAVFIRYEFPLNLGRVFLSAANNRILEVLSQPIELLWAGIRGMWQLLTALLFVIVPSNVRNGKVAYTW